MARQVEAVVACSGRLDNTTSPRAFLYFQRLFDGKLVIRLTTKATSRVDLFSIWSDFDFVAVSGTNLTQTKSS